MRLEQKKDTKNSRNKIGEKLKSEQKGKIEKSEREAHRCALLLLVRERLMKSNA